MFKVAFKKAGTGGYTSTWTNPITGECYPSVDVTKTALGWKAGGYFGKTRKAAVTTHLWAKWETEALALEEVNNLARSNNAFRPDLLIPEEIANQIFDVMRDLNGIGDANWNRGSFTTSVDREVVREYRFGGWLGFGGKFWNEERGFSVSTGNSDSFTRLVAARINEALQDIYIEHYPNRTEASEKEFLGGTLAEWSKLGFRFTAAHLFSSEQRKEFEEVLSSCNGYVLGNVDFCLCRSLEQVLNHTETRSTKAMLDYRKKIGV